MVTEKSSTTERRRGGALTRSPLLRQAGASRRRARGHGGRDPVRLAGPMKHTRRALKGDLSSSSGTTSCRRSTRGSTNWVTTWGEPNDMQVEVDHVDYTRLPALAAAEVKAQNGHDIFGFLRRRPRTRTR